MGQFTKNMKILLLCTHPHVCCKPVWFYFYYKIQILKIFGLSTTDFQCMDKNSSNILQKSFLNEDKWWVNDDTIHPKIKMILLRTFNILELLALFKQIWKQNQHQLSAGSCHSLRLSSSYFFNSSASCCHQLSCLQQLTDGSTHKLFRQKGCICMRARLKLGTIQNGSLWDSGWLNKAMKDLLVFVIFWFKSQPGNRYVPHGMY